VTPISQYYINYRI